MTGHIRRGAGVAGATLLAVAAIASLVGGATVAAASLATGLLAALVWWRSTTEATTRRLAAIESRVRALDEGLDERLAPDRAQRATLATSVAAVEDGLRRIEQRLEEARTSTDGQVDRLDRAHELLRQQDTLLRRSADRQTALRDQLRGISADLHRLPGLAAEVASAYDRLVDHHHPMPELGGWAITPSMLLWLLDHVADTTPQVVLECGSGTSTVWTATALEHIGRGHVTALESDEHYARRTTDDLDRLGLGHRATVLHAPLVETPLPDRDTQRWFDLSGIDLPGPVDLLLVDGPVGASGPDARYPAFPMLAAHLSPTSVVVLDDTNRAEEEAIVRAWCDEEHHGRRLEVVRSVDRSTVMAVTRG